MASALTSTGEPNFTGKRHDAVGEDIPFQYKLHISRQKTSDDPAIDIHAYLPGSITMSVSAHYEQPLANLSPSNVGSMIYRAFGGSFTTKFLSSSLWTKTEPISFTLTFDLVAEYDVEREIREPLRKLYSLVLPREPVAGGFLSSPGPQLSFKKVANSVSSTLTEANSSARKEFSDQVEALEKRLLNGFLSYADSSPTQSTSANYSAASTSADQSSTIDKMSSGFDSTYKKFNTGVASAFNALDAAIEGKISIALGAHMFFNNVIITNITHEDPVRPDIRGNMISSTVTIQCSTMTVPTVRDLPSIIPNGGLSYAARKSQM